jgi:hypothetical protein
MYIEYPSDLLIESINLIDSGHGGQTKDTDGDEADGYDETIYPLDFKQAGHIVDDVCITRQRKLLLAHIKIPR